MPKNQTPRLRSGQEGFHLIPILIVIAVLAVGLVGWRVMAKNKPPAKSQTQASSNKTSTAQDSDVPLKLKSIGFNLDYYDPTTNYAGDMVFTHEDHDLSGHF